MEYLEEHYKELIEKMAGKNFPPGPWMDEPDKIQFVTEVGLPALIVRNRSGALCGYVGVDSKHPYYEKNYDDCNVDCHGGLTYSNLCQPGGKICHKVEDGEDDNIWWLGFDCAHCGDHVPLYDSGWGEDYKNLDYVKSICEDMALQLVNIKKQEK